MFITLLSNCIFTFSPPFEPYLIIAYNLFNRLINNVTSKRTKQSTLLTVRNDDFM